MARTAVMAMVGGVTSVITGGKFANGAITGAFVHLFNAEAGHYANKKAFGRTQEALMQKADSSDYASSIFGGISAWASTIPIFGKLISGISSGFSSLLDINKQLLYAEAGQTDPGSVLIDGVSIVIPIPNKVTDFVIDEFADKGYGYLHDLQEK